MNHPYIEKLNKRGSVPGLSNIQGLLKRLGNPQNEIPVIHVAGTNGKGSTIAFIESIFRQAGLRVGKYTSPAVSSYYERFQIDGRNITETDFFMLLSRVKAAADALEQEGTGFPTAFEVETAVAFLYCTQADIMLLETGMGGRLDATNVVRQPLVTVLTSISMDHMQFLGNTIEQIAAEKAGILRAGVACVSNPANVRLQQVMENQCQMVGAEFLMPEDYKVLEADESHTVFVYAGTVYEMHLPGLFQVDNCVTAIMAVQKAVEAWRRRLQAPEAGEEAIGSGGLLSALDKAVEVSCVQAGVSHAHWPFRLEHVAAMPDIYLDGAHNTDACDKLRISIKQYFGGRPLIYIVGVLQDKEYEKMMEILAPLAAHIYTVTPPGQRGLDGRVLAEVCSSYCGSVRVCSSIAQAVSEARRSAADMDMPVILAFGSLSYLGELKKWVV